MQENISPIENVLGVGFQDIFPKVSYREEIENKDKGISVIDPSMENSEYKLEGNIEEMWEIGFMNNNIPEGYKWTELEEYMMEWKDPNMANKMKELRMKTEEVTIEEAANLFHEIKIMRIKERHNEEKEILINEINFAEKKAERQNTALRIALEEKETLKNKDRELKMEIKIVNKEIKETKRRIKGWEEIGREKDREIERLRKSNFSLIRELEQVRLASYERKRNERHKKLNENQ